MYKERKNVILLGQSKGKGGEGVPEGGVNLDNRTMRGKALREESSLGKEDWLNQGGRRDVTG